MTGPALRAIRAKLGYTQVQLARALAVTSNTVARWERDEMRITPPMVRLITLVAERPPTQDAPRGKTRRRKETRG